jgi:asparagine synthase (glutamine-hydrolysing)
MCGIAGWVSYDGDLKSHKDVITTMTKTMARRGPDAGGVWIDRHVGLRPRRRRAADAGRGIGTDNRLPHLHRRGLQLRGVA